MADGFQRDSRSGEREAVTAVESVNGPMDLEASTGPRAIDERLREMEREVVDAGRKRAQLKPQQSQQPTDRDQPASSMSLFGGIGLAAAGAYLLMERVTITGGTYLWNRWGLGQNSFGLTLIPLVLGIGMLIYRKSAVGWALTGIGSLVILLGILGELNMSFRSASLFELVLMLTMLTAGLGLMARSLRKA